LAEAKHLRRGCKVEFCGMRGVSLEKFERACALCFHLALNLFGIVFFFKTCEISKITFSPSVV
jgi:hypothetical protein